MQRRFDPLDAQIHVARVQCHPDHVACTAEFECLLVICDFGVKLRLLSATNFLLGLVVFYLPGDTSAQKAKFTAGVVYLASFTSLHLD